MAFRSGNKGAANISAGTPSGLVARIMADVTSTSSAASSKSGNVPHAKRAKRGSAKSPADAPAEIEKSSAHDIEAHNLSDAVIWPKHSEVEEGASVTIDEVQQSTSPPIGVPLEGLDLSR